MHYWSPLHAHARWMAELRETIYGDGALNTETVGRDDQCEIGRWLYGEGVRHRQLEEYQQAKGVHAALHRHAATVVFLAKSGRRTEALDEFSIGGGLRRLSKALVRALSRLNRRIRGYEDKDHVGNLSAPL